MNNIGTGVVHVHLMIMKVFAQIALKLVMLTMMFPMPNTVNFSVTAEPKERNHAIL